MLVISLTGMLVVGQMYVVLPLFALMAGDWATSAGAATWTSSVFGFAYAAGFLVSGPAADRFGPRRVILTGLTVTIATTALVAAAPGLIAGCVLRAVQGLTAAAFAPPALSYVTSRVQPHRRATALTCLSSSYLAAGVLAQVAAQLLGGWLGWRSVFLVGAVAVAGVVLALRAVLLPDRPVEAGSASGSPVQALATMARLLGNPRLLALYGATVTVLASFVAVYSGLALAGPAGLAGDPQALLWLRLSALPAMVLVPVASPWLGRLPAAGRAGMSLAVAALAMAGIAVTTPGVVALSVLLLVFVAGIAAAAPGAVQAVGEQAPHARGAAGALYAFMIFVGASLGSPLATATTGHGFAVLAWSVTAVLAAGALLAAVAARLIVRARAGQHT